MYVHVTLVPFIEAAGELKTKPTQHSVNELRRIGIHPDVIVCRSHEELSRDIRDKIALFADVDPGAVVASPDVPDVYLVPRVLQAEGLDRLVCEKLGLDARDADLGEWDELLERIHERRELVEIALVGKYVKLQDAYLSVHEALKHAGLHHGCAVRVRWVDAENMSYEETAELLDTRRRRARARRLRLARAGRARSSPAASRASGGSRTSASASACTSRSPSSRGTSSVSTARTRRRWIPRRRIPVIDLLPEQKGIEDLGGTMRLGAQAVELAEGTRARELYGEAMIHERHRHRYEVNNLFRERLVDAGLVVSGTFQEGRLVEIVELPDHPWFVASQFHPEFKSRPTRPAPLFRGFVGAALDRQRTRAGETVASFLGSRSRRRGGGWRRASPSPGTRASPSSRPSASRTAVPLRKPVSCISSYSSAAAGARATSETFRPSSSSRV